MQGRPVDLVRVEFHFDTTRFTTVYPVMAELYVSELLDRQQLRDLSDQHKTQEAILAHLK